MELSDGLRTILKGRLGWSKSRLDCFISLLLALICAKRMNLTQLVLHFNDKASPKSRYRRLQRFFQLVVFDYNALAHLIMEMLGFHGKSYYLTLDRTNWKWGQSNLNILTLAIVYKGIAVPIYWLVLNKQGNSNQRERIALLQRFIRQFGRHKILGVLADREFIGDQWWQWLSGNGIPYLIRMKENQLLTTNQSYSKKVENLFRDLKPGKDRQLRKRQRIGTQWIWLSGLKLESGELLILASNMRFQQPLETYALRWEIENLFQSLKGRGFHLEETRLTRYYRIKKVMALQAIAFCWAHKTGEWKHQAVKPLKIKKHGRPECSLFRYGLDELTHSLLHAFKTVEDKLRLWILFLCPPDMIHYECTDAKMIALKI
jgi:hypothetical protein